MNIVINSELSEKLFVSKVVELGYMSSNQLVAKFSSNKV